MLAFDDRVVAVGDRDDIQEAVRFGVPRLAEFLDSGVHFSQSGAFWPGAEAVLAEIEETCESYLEGDVVQPRTMIHRAGDTLAFLERSERHLRDWFATWHVALRSSLADVAKSSNNRAKLDPMVDRLRDDVGEMRKQVEDQHSGYAERLIACVESRWTASPSSLGEWRTFDRDLLDLAGLVLTSGRTGPGAVEALAMACSESDAANVVTAANAVLRTERRQYEVVAVLAGTTDVAGVERLGCDVVAYPAAWKHGDDKSNQRLRRFLNTRRDGLKRCALRVGVSAWDPEDAFDEASKVVDRVADLVSGAHRTARFGLLDEALVLDLADMRTVAIPPRFDAGPHTAHYLEVPDSGPLLASLRYAGLSRAERLPVVSVMQAWIAIECLGEGARAVNFDGSHGDSQGPATFLPKRLAALMSLAAVANLWPRSWAIAARTGAHPDRLPGWEPLAGWLGSKSNPSFVPSLKTWADLLVRTFDSGSQASSLEPGADVAAAASYFRHLLASWPPYARRRLAETARLLWSGKALDDWAGRIYAQAFMNVHRFQLMRHRAVHNGMHDARGAKRLALASHGCLDAIYEVLPHWVAAGDSPWEELDEVFRWRRNLFRTWTKRATAAGFQRPYEMDPRLITRRDAA